MSWNKEELYQSIIQKLEENLETLINNAIEAKEASTNEESKAENKYDTRGLEASYLASGQAQRVKELQEVIFNLKKINLQNFSDNSAINISALVELKIDDSDGKWFFILPASGITLQVDGTPIQTISLEAPLGKALYNQKTGNDFDLNGKEYQILKVL